MLKNNEKCPFCGRYNNRALAIDAIIVKDRSILLIKRKSEPFKDYWALPGGHVDWNEKVEDAVIREVKEETGLKVSFLKLFGIYSSPKRSPSQNIASVYKTYVEGIPKAGSDAGEAIYFSFNKIPIKLAFDHKEIINDYLKTIE